jgi:hypothetical protein
MAALLLPTPHVSVSFEGARARLLPPPPPMMVRRPDSLTSAPLLQICPAYHRRQPHLEEDRTGEDGSVVTAGPDRKPPPSPLPAAVPPCRCHGYGLRPCAPPHAPARLRAAHLASPPFPPPHSSSSPIHHHLCPSRHPPAEGRAPPAAQRHRLLLQQFRSCCRNQWSKHCWRKGLAVLPGMVI